MPDNFFRPASLKEAVEYIDKNDCRLIAGGTDIVVQMRAGKISPGILVDISSLQELKGIREDKDRIIIESACTHADVEKSHIVKENLPMLAEGCSLVGSTLIRNRGTLGGNVVNSSTSADSIPPLLIYDTDIVIVSAEGERKLPIKDFFLNKEKVKLEKNEIVKEFQIKPLANYNWRIFKVGRRKSLAISRLTLAVAVKVENGYIKDLRLCPGAMLPKHGRLTCTEDQFKNQIFNEQTIQLITEAGTKEAIELSGRRWSTEYKEPVLCGLIQRLLNEILNEAEA